MGQLIGNETVRVDVDDAWYLLRRELGWYDQKIARIENTMKLVVAKSVLDSGAAGEDDLVEVRMTKAEHDLQRLCVRLTGWSHGERLTEHNVKRLSPDHAAQLLAEIDALEAAQRDRELPETVKNE